MFSVDSLSRKLLCLIFWKMPRPSCRCLSLVSARPYARRGRLYRIAYAQSKEAETFGNQGDVFQ